MGRFYSFCAISLPILSLDTKDSHVNRFKGPTSTREEDDCQSNTAIHLSSHLQTEHLRDDVNLTLAAATRHDYHKLSTRVTSEADFDAIPASGLETMKVLSPWAVILPLGRTAENLRLSYSEVIESVCR